MDIQNHANDDSKGRYDDNGRHKPEDKQSKYMENMEQLIDLRNNNGTVSKHMAMKIVDAKPGWAKGEMLCQEIHMNPIGSVHGGMIFILADFTAGMAALTRGKVVTTANSSSYFLNAAYMPEKLYAEATEIKTGLCLSTYDVVVTDDKGKLISKMIFEFYNLQIDFDEYVENMINTQTDLYFDPNVFGKDKVEAKTFGLIDEIPGVEQ